MFNKIMREVKTVSGSLLTVLLLLIVLFFVLNFVRSRRIPYLSPVANWAESHANGSAYDQIGVLSPQAAVIPSDMGPML